MGGGGGGGGVGVHVQCDMAQVQLEDALSVVSTSLRIRLSRP